jgi:hypothetical protein
VLLARIFILARAKLVSKGVSGDGVHRCSLARLAKLKLSPPSLYLKLELGIEFFGHESVMHFSSRETRAGSFRTVGMSVYDVPRLPSVRTAALVRMDSKKMARKFSTGFENTLSKIRSEHYVVFIEGTDPANFLCVMALYFLVVQRAKGEKGNRTLDVVLMGRHVDLGAQCLTPPLLKKEFEKGRGMKDILKAKPDMQSNAQDSQAAMNDLAVRLQMFLSSAGIRPSEYSLYNGGISPTAMISHEMHQREFLFDRADLSGTGNCGGIVDSGSYWKIIRGFNATEDVETRQQKLRSTLRSPDQPLENLEALARKLVKGSMTKMVVSGPMTSCKELLEIGGQKLADKVQGVYATMGAWDIGKEGAQGLFNNQFNIGCDIDAAATMLCKDGPQSGSPEVLVTPLTQKQPDSPNPPLPGTVNPVPMQKVTLKCGVYLVPTETTKHRQLAFTPEDLQKFNPPKCVQHIYQLWYELNQKRPFFLFDLAPVLAVSSSVCFCLLFVPRTF